MVELGDRIFTEFLEYYDLRRSHQGYRPAGRTAAQALQEVLGITDPPPLVTAVKGEVPRRSIGRLGVTIAPCSQP
jgi:hypothetical protein